VHCTTIEATKAVSKVLTALSSMRHVPEASVERKDRHSAPSDTSNAHAINQL
jgi:hypothetical protein